MDKRDISFGAIEGCDMMNDIRSIFKTLYKRMNEKIQELNDEISRDNLFTEGHRILLGMQLMTKVVSDYESELLHNEETFSLEVKMDSIMKEYTGVTFTTWENEYSTLVKWSGGSWAGEIATGEFEIKKEKSK